MIAAANERLMQWAHDAVPDLPVVLGPPDAGDERTRVFVHLLDLIPAKLRANVRPAPFEARMRYLVGVAGADANETSAALGALLEAATTTDRFELELGTVPLELWRAFGAVPTAALYLLQDLRIERSAETAPPVRVTPRVELEPAATLLGRLVAGSGRPVADARVAIPTLRLATRTDASGLFRFTTVRPREDALDLVVTTGNRKLALRHRGPWPGDGPLLVKLDQAEGDECRNT